MSKKKPYTPEALIYLLMEVERELRQHGRTNAARLVSASVSAVNEDIGRSMQGSRLLM